MLSVKANVKTKRKALTREEWAWLSMLAIPVLLLLVFHYATLLGLKIAFERFIPAKGLFGNQKWVGLDNFRYVFSLKHVWRAVWNTLSISVWKITLGIVVPVVVALMLNETRGTRLRRGVQTAIYLPHFLSWVILAGIFTDLLSTYGVVNQAIQALGGQPIFFLGSNRYFRSTLIVTAIWKDFGYSSIIYLATITGIDQEQYESARIDGAGRFRCMRYITLPGLAGIIALMSVLNIGSLLGAGFEQVLNLYSPQVYETGDIIDTFVYRFGMLEAKYGPSQAVGLMKSVISTFLTVTAYALAYKYADYSLF